MGRSPRSNKTLPVFYVGQYPIIRGTIPRSRSPGQSPTRRGLGHHNAGAGRMGLLRLLVMLGMGLLLVSLLYVQFATAIIAPRGIVGSLEEPTNAAAQAAATAPLSPDLQQRQQLPTARPGGDQPTTAPAPAGGFPAPHLTHLILVAGHAVYTGLDFAVANMESSWFLEAYQQVAGEAQSFLDHIRLGIQAAAHDPSALLLFSGGQTRKAAGPRSEGLSYWLVAEAADWFGHPDVRGRAYTEEHARDSFENLLFSLCRFHEITGRYPARITAVSYTLKQKRFEQLHRAAVRFPADAFDFIGTPVPPAAKGAAQGEVATVAAFLRDPYGCSGTLLAKKSRRDPFAVGAPHSSRCPAMAGLLQHCGPRPYAGALPWDRGKAGAVGAAKAAAAGAGKVQGRHSSRSGIYT